MESASRERKCQAAGQVTISLPALITADILFPSLDKRICSSQRKNLDWHVQTIATILCKAQKFLVKGIFTEKFRVYGRAHHNELKYAHCIPLNQSETLHTYFTMTEFHEMLSLNQTHLQGVF